MPKVAVMNMQGAAVGEIELSDNTFGAEVNEAAMHLVVRSQLAAKRQGTQSALTRSEVRGGGKKIYRQKGTGNARHHSNRAPQFRHGGVVFAPKPRDYSFCIPRKVRRLAMKSALTRTSSFWTSWSFRKPRPRSWPRCSRIWAWPRRRFWCCRPGMRW